MNPSPDTDESAAASSAAPEDWRGYTWAVAGVTLAALVSALLQSRFALANIVMLFLLVVVGVAYRHGRGPAILAAVLGVAVFDFFFVPPQLSFAVADAQYLVTFAVMLGTGLVIAQLTSRLRQSAGEAMARERRAAELYELARVLSGALAESQVVDAAQNFFARCFDADIALLPRLSDGRLADPSLPLSEAGARLDMNVARAAFSMESMDAAPAVSSMGVHYLPLRAPMRVRGVLVVVPRRADKPVTGRAGGEDLQYMATAAALAAIALERVHFVTVAREATVQIAGERLRNTLLSALSHDLRTPLTAILGSAESLRLDGNALPAGHLALIEAITDQARRTGELVENILEMARLESGTLQVKKEWHSLEEIIGAALAARATQLETHIVHVTLPADMPMVHCEALMIERVLVNLLENAAKYTPAGSRIDIAAMVDFGDGADASAVRVSVTDNGPGIRAGSEEIIFDKFVRATSAGAVPGLGLGLAICRSMVEAHGGRMQASNMAVGGAMFAFTLPAGTPPAVPDEPDGVVSP